MRQLPHWRELTSVVLVFALLCVFLPPSPAVAGWVGTRPALEGPKARLASVLERAEVVRTLRALGVDPAEAQRRVAGLTDAEAKMALDKFDSMPAAGDGVGVVVGALLFVFVVLLITDLLGLTHVFPFVKRTVR